MSNIYKVAMLHIRDPSENLVEDTGSLSRKMHLISTLQDLGVDDPKGAFWRAQKVLCCLQCWGWRTKVLSPTQPLSDISLPKKPHVAKETSPSGPYPELLSVASEIPRFLASSIPAH